MKRAGIWSILLVSSYVVTAVSSTFTCYRPTTPCDSWNGQCMQDGSCRCLNGAKGKQCEISPNYKQMSGTCAIFNHCTRGTCYDDGATPMCDCPDGFYGTQCELPMVMVECDTKKMWINVLPYGYDPVTWQSPPPLTGENFTCALDKVDVFLKNNPTFSNNVWEGFAGKFPHVGDTCAGNPIIMYESATHITYARLLYLAYSPYGPDQTDQTLRLTCDVRKPPPPPPPKPALAPAQVKISFWTPQGYPMQGPIKLGAKMRVVFALNTPNSGGYDDAQIHSCHIWDTVTRQQLAVVDRGCPQHPVGERLYKQRPGVAVLAMTVYRLPGMTNLSFKCQVRVCKTQTDRYCSAVPQCGYRPRRSTRDVTSSAEDNMLTVETIFPV